MENKKNNQEIIDDVYELYYNKVKNMTTEEYFDRIILGEIKVIIGILKPHTRDFRPYTKEEFINKINNNELTISDVEELDAESSLNKSSYF